MLVTDNHLDQLVAVVESELDNYVLSLSSKTTGISF